MKCLKTTARYRFTSPRITVINKTNTSVSQAVGKTEPSSFAGGIAGDAVAPKS
jgi:hypothetical protein